MNPTDPPTVMSVCEPLTGTLPSLKELQKEYDTEHPDDVLDDMVRRGHFADKETGWLEGCMMVPDCPPLFRKLALHELKKRWANDSNGFSLSEVMERNSRELRWGSFGLSGKEPMRIRFLCELDTSHIQNILIFCCVEQWYRLVFLRLLRMRWQTEKTATV